MTLTPVQTGYWNCPWIPEQGDCRDISTKINRTASTISHSMTNLNQLVETKRSDTRIITEVTGARISQGCPSIFSYFCTVEPKLGWSNLNPRFGPVAGAP